MIRVLGAVLLVLVAMLGTGTRMFGGSPVVLGSGGVIAIAFVHACGQMKGVGLRVGIRVAVLDQQEKDFEGAGQVAPIDVLLGSLCVAAQVFGTRLRMDVRALTVRFVMLLRGLPVMVFGTRVRGRRPMPLTRGLMVAGGRVAVPSL